MDTPSAPEAASRVPMDVDESPDRPDPDGAPEAVEQEGYADGGGAGAYFADKIIYRKL